MAAGEGVERGGAGDWSVARFCVAATWRRRLPGYVALVILVGALGGLAMASVAGARRTQSSYTTYLKSTNPPDVLVVTGLLNPEFGNGQAYQPALFTKIERLPHVVGVFGLDGLNVLPMLHGAPESFPTLAPSAGSGDGETGDTNIHTFSVVHGRLSNPHRADEIMVEQYVARVAHWRVGQHIVMGVWTNAQTNQPGFGTAKVAPFKTITVTVVGIVKDSTQIIEDDADFTDYVGIFTPAFTRPLLQCCTNATQAGIQVRPASDIPQVQSEVGRLIVRGFPIGSLTGAITKADLALRPFSIALYGFGLIVAVAALVIGSQVVGRILRGSDPERRVLRSLGASPGAVAASSLAGAFGAIVAGVALSIGVAYALSPIAPIGPVRPYYPYLGLSFDPLVLLLGAVVLLVVLVGTAVVLEVRLAPQRAATRRRRWPVVRSRLASAASRAGLPAPVGTGLHFALEPGTGTSRVPVRSVMAAGVLSIVVLATTVTFGSSLDSLVAHPPLYGWDFNDLLWAGTGAGNAPAGPAHRLLGSDKYVQSWSGYYSALGSIDGQPVPILGERVGAPIQPPLIAGHGLDATNQVVLAAGTIAALHQHIGGTVTIPEAIGAPPLRIVGIATFPALGSAGSQHLEMGSGALVDENLIPAPAKNPFHDPLTGPQGIFVRLKAGSGAAGLRSLNRIAGALSNNANFGVAVVPLLRPAQIVDYRSAGTTPAILGGALGAGVVAALLLTLLASVRARRRDFALLKTLGFTRRQVTSTIVWQSTVAVAVSVIVGIPLGVVLGRTLWGTFAREIYAVPSPVVPVMIVAIIAVGSIVLCDLAATVPGRRAANTPVAAVLRSE